jgi:hypothetical protein
MTRHSIEVLFHFAMELRDRKWFLQKCDVRRIRKSPEHRIL